MFAGKNSLSLDFFALFVLFNCVSEFRSKSIVRAGEHVDVF